LPGYRYRYLAPEGPKEAYIEAEDEEAALNALRERGVIPLDLAPVKERRRRKLPARILAAYFRQLASLMRVGDALRLDQMLRLLEEQLPRWAREAYAVAPRALAQGFPLPRAVEQTGLFPSLVVATLEVADTSGKGEEVVRRLAGYYSRIARFQSKLRSALTYPTLILAFALLVTWALMTFIVPQFVAIIQDTGVPVPFVTEVTIAVSKIVSSPLFLLGASLALVGAARLLARHLENPENRIRFERLLFRLPAVGPLVLYLNLADLAGTLRLAYEAGISIHQGLTLTRSVVGLQHLKEVLEGAREGILRGASVSAAFSAAPHSEILPDIFKSLLRVGETGGSLDEMLKHAEEIYSEEAESILESIGSVIEPVLLVVVGTLIGGIMLSVLLPYFSLMQGISGGGVGAP